MPDEVSARDCEYFTIGLTMAGAVSAGAYTAGVIDVLFRSLDEHNARAISDLERIEGTTYRRFGSIYAQAMATLFEQYWDQPERPTERIVATASALAGVTGEYGVNDQLLIVPLVRASWFTRLQGGGTDLALPRNGAQWLANVRRAGGDEAWALTLTALAGEERPEFGGGDEQRIRRWMDVRPTLDVNRADHAIPAAIVEFFLGSPIDAADGTRREDNLRRAIRDAHARTPQFWMAEAGPDAFADYCIAVSQISGDRERAAELLRRAAGSNEPGVFALLDGREESWLPLRR